MNTGIFLVSPEKQYWKYPLGHTGPVTGLIYIYISTRIQGVISKTAIILMTMLMIII